MAIKDDIETVRGIVTAALKQLRQDDPFAGRLADEVMDPLAALDRIEAEVVAIRARVEELDSALCEAIKDIDSWGAYAPEYFQKKHDLEGTLKRLRAIVREDG